MSVPDTLHYARAAGRSTRQSEFELAPALYEQAAGVWIDCFERDWVDEATVCEHREAGKAVCLVSPELHGRSYESAWDAWRTWDVRRRRRL